MDNIRSSVVLKTQFMKQLRAAFSGAVPSLDEAFCTNDFSYFTGCDVSLLINGEITYEEYFVRNILKKVSNVSVEGLDPDAEALLEFKAFLAKQQTTNVSVKLRLSEVDMTTSVGRVLIGARAILSDALSTFNAYRVEPRFTSGSSVDLSRLEGSNPLNRVRSSSGWDVTNRNLKAYFYKFYDDNRFDLSQIMPGSPGCDSWEVAIAAVPKVWKISRIIGQQLIAPLAVQSGIGDELTRIASTVGLHIPSAQERHRNIARFNSIGDDSLMTLDQSHASDNILTCLGEFLLPPRVSELLDAVTPRKLVFADGTICSTQMLATAGNGYIFPLQTLIFWALAKAVCLECKVRPEIYSYGDDLIAPKRIYTQLCVVFDFLGLQVNHSKTFHDGPFRESCGGDYLSGSDVRPLYVKEIPTTTAQWIRCINGIRRVGYYANLNDWRTNNFRRFWLWCIASVKSTDRLYAPKHYGDTAVSTEDEFLYKLSFKRGYAINGKTYKYPFDGIHPSGHPYSGWYIETYALKSTGTGVTFGQTCQGIAAHLIVRTLALDSVKGSGLRLKRFTHDEHNVLLAKPVWRLGYLPFFEKDEYKIVRIHSPFFSGPPAPSDDMAELFHHLGKECCIYDVDAVVHRGQVRYESTMANLLDALNKVLHNRKVIEDAARAVRMNF